MFDFKSLLNDMEQSRRRSLLSVGVVCFLALAMIIGLGVFSSTSQLREQPSASPTMTGRELFNKVMEQEKAALEKQAELEARQAQTTTDPLAKEYAHTTTTQTDQKAASNTSTAKLTVNKVRKNTSQAIANGQAETLSQPIASPAANSSQSTKHTSPSSSKADAQLKTASPEKENPYFSILHEPWPPSSGAGTTKVESTFVPRLGSMFLMLCITCTIIWLSLKIFAPLFNKFTGATTTQKNHLHIVEKKALAPNKSIVLIETHGRHLLLGMTDQSITTLANFDIIPPQLSSTPKENNSQEIVSESAEPSELKSPSPHQVEPAPADLAQESQGKKRNLLKEVISQHLSSLSLSKDK